MKKVVFLILALVLFSAVASAEIIINQQPNEIYNLEDSVSVPVTVKTLSDYSGNLLINLICDGKYINFYKNGVSLKTGEEKTFEAFLVLNEENIGSLTGDCTIKAVLGNDYVLTNEFKISNLVFIQSKVEQIEFNPGEGMVVKGNAVKENGEPLNGFVRANLVTENDSQNAVQLGTVNNGYFSVNVSLPKGLKAGSYLVQVDVFDLDSEEKQINKGFMNYNIAVRQVPTSLEIFVDNYNIEPGTNLKFKAILHDQTGEKISSNAILTLKKSKNEIIQQIDVSTEEYFEYTVSYNEPPSNWTIVGVSNMLNAEATIFITENKEVSVDFVNGTVLITNVGNVPYNDSVLVKIGNSSLNINVALNVGDSKRYELSAPNGQYNVEVISDGESKFKESVLLTGKAIDIKEFGASKLGFSNAFVWVFVAVILVVGGFIFYRKSQRKNLFGGFKKKHKNYPAPVVVRKQENMKNKFLINSNNRARLSLSIKGENQESAVVCLRIKNINEIERKGIEDNMNKISSVVENTKTFVYENEGNIYFIFSPRKTKTFRNEKSAIELSQALREILVGHNKIFKNKLDFGISIVNGYIVSAINYMGELEFMGMGNILSNAKKIAGLSSGDVFLSREAKEKAGALIKPEERNLDGNKVYVIREMRERDQYSKFIGNFLQGLERDKKEKERRDRKFGNTE